MAAKRRFQYIQHHLTIHLHRKRNLKISINNPNTTCQPSTMLLTFILTLAVRAVKSTFDEDIRAAIPEDAWGLVEDYSNARALDALLKLNHEWNENGDLKEKMEEKRVAEDLERAQLVNELEGFRTRTNGAPRSHPNYFSQITEMDASVEIKHFLNGFDFRMYEWMAAFHRTNCAMQRQIEEFATKLAQHRATYPRPPPHRRGQQEEMPKFDAFVRMRDNIMKILQNRVRKDHIMFQYGLERRALIEMMELMETIGIEIGYPGVQKMQTERDYVKISPVIEQEVPELLSGDISIKQWQPVATVPPIVELLARDSCIGRKATDTVVDNVQDFVRIWDCKASFLSTITRWARRE